MVKRLALFLLAFFTLMGSLRAAGSELWNELRYTHPFSRSNFELFWATENRWDRGMDHFYLFNTSLGFSYRPAPWFVTGFFYLYETSTKNNFLDDFNEEHRFNPFYEFTLKLGSSELRQRSLFELRYLPDDGVSGDFRLRYRGRLRWQKKIPAGEFSFTPYVSNELFIEPERGNFNQDRLIVGNSFGFLKGKINFDLYYMLLSSMNTSGVWTRVNALGTSLGFRY